MFKADFGRIVPKFLLGFRLSAVALIGLATVRAESLFVGFNTQTPVQVYSSSGAYQEDLGPEGAIGVVLAPSSYFFLLPNLSSAMSTVTEYNAALTPGASFSVPDLIDNGAAGPNGTLYLAGYSGDVYQVSSGGTVLDSWATGYTHIGVAFNGTNVYTTEGDGGSDIDIWSATGTHTGQVATPLTGLYGLGYDSTDSDLWASSTDFVYQLDASGDLLTTLDITGDSRTPDGAVHDSVAVGDLLGSTGTPVPEPAPLALLGIAGLLLFVRFGLRNRWKAIARVAGIGACAAGSALPAVTVSLTPSIGSAPVGTTIVWTASATDSSSSSAAFTYQFSVGTPGSPLQVRQDFSAYNTYAWTPSDQEGNFVVQVTANSSTGAGATDSASYAVSSRVTGSTPVVSTTANPLVALYSLPPCAAGRSARVRFLGPGDITWQATPSKPCTGTTSLNFYIAGMRASTPYTLQQDVFYGPFDTMGPLLTFTTGAIPAGTNIPGNSMVTSATAPNNTAYPVVLTVAVAGATSHVPFATDTEGRVIWYLSAFQQINQGYPTRPVVGGTILGDFDDLPAGKIRALLREWDLAGNVVRETNATIVSQQLVAMGTDPITSFTHEALRFPNGDTAVLGVVERVVNQGAGLVDVLGDMVIILDSNLQVKWFWNEFDHLDTMRPAVLGEVCTKVTAGCGPFYNPAYTVANDWTHSNAIAPTSDGNLIVSVRHQDWVIKINYQNGLAQWQPGQPDNTILWRLGADGNFSLPGGSPAGFFDARWFSHQHDATFDSNGQLTLFDNGNTRISLYGGDSRGQAWQLNEQELTATPVLSQSLGQYSAATGSAELLEDGNYFFYLGVLGAGSSNSVEINPSGAFEFSQADQSYGYRCFRMRSLYSEY